MTYDESNGTYILSNNQNYYSYYFPFIIYYFSPTYVASYALINLPKGKKISKEQLIGITCGVAFAMFFVLYIIISVIHRKYKIKSNLEYSLSSSKIDNDNQEIINNDNQVEKQNNISHSSSEADINFWI